MAEATGGTPASRLADGDREGEREAGDPDDGGDPAHLAARVRDHARDDPLWRLHEVPGPVPWLSPERLDEQRRALPNSVFGRLHLNEWVEPDDRLALLEDVRACVTHDGPLPPDTAPPT